MKGILGELKWDKTLANTLGSRTDGVVTGRVRLLSSRSRLDCVLAENRRNIVTRVHVSGGNDIVHLNWGL